jgi:hypothetical protein
MGCKNWAIAMILEIAALDGWKMGCQNNGTLNMQELAARATYIEDRVEGELAVNAKALLLSTADPFGVDCWRTRAITNVFGCSALTYLHVVRFGANPELPKIRESVLRTLEAFHALPKVHWIRSLVWPFCAAGCMAMTQDERKFRNIACTASSQGLVTFGIAARVVQECWVARHEINEPSFPGVDWRTAMKRLGIHVLMV